MVNRLGRWALALAGATGVSAQAANEVVLHSFIFAPRGAGPCGNITRDAAGNIYGTAAYGGTGNSGVVYRLDNAGHETVLYSFTGVAQGGGPCTGVTLDSAGNLYGTTGFGGTANAGVVYKLDMAGHETVLYSFTGGADGASPSSGVILDWAGNLYGTTYSGGAGKHGVVYKLDVTGKETVLHTFRGGSNDGSGPIGGVIRDPAGHLYGTTQGGGTLGFGTVYMLGAGGQETVLHSFAYDGCYPSTGVVRDSSGNLYGTAGCGQYNQGVIYKVDTTGLETVLYNFPSETRASAPAAGVILDAAGNLYGTLPLSGRYHEGVVYKLDPAGNYMVLHNFTGGPDGGFPQAGVVRDSSGNLYGTTQEGGNAHVGVIYKLDALGHESVLYNFEAGRSGYLPDAGVIQDSAGNLYGTTDSGGRGNAGVVYKLDISGRETVLYAFSGGADGADPYTAGVILDSTGNIYGTTQFGGMANQGVVYKLDTSGKETVLHSFNGTTDGGHPQANLIRDAAGNLYGTTQTGTIYKLDPAGTLTVLYAFPCMIGCSPYPGLIRDAQGNLYSTTNSGGNGAGSVYKLSPSGTLTVLYNFTGGADGGFPYSGVVQDSAGNLYGTTYNGGSARSGTVFKLDTAGRLTTLYSFTGGADGGIPESGVVLDSAGNLYGTTTHGGTANAGVVYKVDASGQETVLYSFTCGADGCLPLAGLFRDALGNLYGTTQFGGNYGTAYKGPGVVFEIQMQ